jgi:protein SCO1/2
MKKLWVVGTIFLALLVIVTGILFVNAKRRTLHGAVITPPFPVAEIHLTDQNGQSFMMSSLRGKVVLLYFGYTNCQNECPLTMAHLKLAVDSLGGNSKDVQVIMVTTDPARDTQQALKDWLAKFDPGFIGLYGTPDELAKVWGDYGVAVEDGGETHSDFTFVIDRSGNLRETFLPDSLPAEEAADTNLLLSGY